MGWIPKCMPRWNANPFRFMKFPSVLLTDGCHINQAVSQSGQWPSGMASFFFLSVFFLFTEENSEIFQTGERKERKSSPLHHFHHFHHHVHIHLFHLPSEVKNIATRGQHEFRKHSGFLGEKKKKDGNYSGRAIKATLCFWSPIIGSVMINMPRLLNLC